MAPKSIYSCRLFISSLWLSAVYQIIDQSILSSSGWEEREGWEKKAGVENSCGPSVKMAPKIAQSGWRQLCLQPPPVGFTHLAKILCWNVFHQLFLQLAVAGGGSKGPATPSEKELKRWIWGKTGSHRDMRFVRAHWSSAGVGPCVLLKLWSESGHLAFSFPAPQRFSMRWRNEWWKKWFYIPPSVCLSLTLLLLLLWFIVYTDFFLYCLFCWGIQLHEALQLTVTPRSHPGSSFSKAPQQGCCV